MEIYDYRNITDYKTEKAIDEATTKDIKELSEIMRDIIPQNIGWFQHSVLPLLKDYSELTASILTIEEMGTNKIVQIQNGYGFDITDECKSIYPALIAATYIHMSVQNDEIVLKLIYEM